MSRKRNTKWIIEQSKLLFGNSFDYQHTEYTDAKTKINFRCRKHNYLFGQTSNNHLNSKYPCKLCLQEFRRTAFSDSIDTFKNKIRAKYGEKYDFGNATYINQRTPISLKCLKHNKVFTKEPQVFLRGHGCDLCAKEEFSTNLSKLTLIEIKKFVTKIDGKCLSEEYINNETPIDFECDAGHKFKKSWSAVKNHLRWCPKCSPNKLIGESLTRLILEHLLELKFPSVYIKEMEGLQLDGFNSRERIAFEYQGYQHYTENTHFHKNEERFKSQIERDNHKKNLCKKNKIILIEIFEFKTIRAGRIQIFVNQIKDKLKELKLSFNHEPFELNLVELYRGKKSELYEQAKRIVEKKNGTLQKFIGAESKHTFTCSNGHKTTNRVLSVIIKSKASCPMCKSNSKYEALKKIIESRGGKLVENKLKPRGYSEIYNWICNNGHKKKSKGQYLFDGYWCSECQKEAQKINLNLKQLAEFKEDVTSGKYYQRDLPKKYGFSDGVYRRMISELGLTPKYIPQDRKAQKKHTKGKLFQIDPNNFDVIKEFESLESVKHEESGLYKPEGIRQQMKKNKKAYGYYWCRANDYRETIRMIKLSNSKKL